MQHANPQLSKEKAFHLTLHGAIQQEDGRFSWKYDNYTYNFSAMALSTDETISLWQNISCPVLLINASDGLEWRTGQNGTLEHFTNVQLLDVGDAGHWTYHDQPVVVSTMMQEFIEGAVLANG
jgi:pimeloyl-ACP methyl ester carboxylesterase